MTWKRRIRSWKRESVMRRAVQFYQSALVKLKAATSKSVSPISTRHSTINMSQRLLSMKSECAKRQTKYNKSIEEYRERNERLINERNQLKDKLKEMSIGGQMHKAVPEP